MAPVGESIPLNIYRVGELLSISDTASSPSVSSWSILRLSEECQS